MGDTRVQVIGGKRVIDIMPADPKETIPQKERYTEDQLLRQQAYFQEMIDKGTEGLERVNSLLAAISDATKNAAK